MNFDYNFKIYHYIDYKKNQLIQLKKRNLLLKYLIG